MSARSRSAASPLSDTASTNRRACSADRKTIFRILALVVRTFRSNWRSVGLRVIASMACNHSKKPRKAAIRRLILEGLYRSEEHTSELQSRGHLVCRLLLEKKK